MERRKLYQKIDHFLFQKINCEFIWFYRVYIGFIFLFIYLQYMPDAISFYGANGIMTHLSYQDMLLANIIPQEQLDTWGPILWHIIGLSSIAIILGFYSKPFLVLACLVHTHFLYMNSQIYEGANYLLKIYAFMFLLFPLDAKYSILKKKINPIREFWLCILLRIQIFGVYLVPSLTRITNKTANDDYWATHIFVEALWTRLPPYEWILTIDQDIIGFFTKLVIYLELTSPIFLVLPFTRKITVFLLFGLHGSILIFTKIYIWQLSTMMMVSVYLVNFSKRKL